MDDFYKNAFIVNVSSHVPQIHTYCQPEEAEEAKKKAEAYARECAARCRQNAALYPQCAGQLQSAEEYDRARYEIMTWEQFSKLEREALLGDPIQRVTEEDFNDALDVLPPLRWETHNGVNEFCMSEMWTGTYTTQYAHVLGTDEYYCKMVDCRDRSTWIHNILMKQKEEMENATASA